MIKFPIFYLEYDEQREVIQDDFNRETWEGFNEQTIHFQPVRLHREHNAIPTWHVQTLEPKFDIRHVSKVWLVIVRYTDGGTFGRTTGYWVVKEICESVEEANEIQTKIYQGTYGETKHQEWVGYFASLESVGIHEMEILPSVEKDAMNPLPFPQHIIDLCLAINVNEDMTAVPALHDALLEICFFTHPPTKWTPAASFNISKLLLGKIALCSITPCSTCTDINKYMSRNHVIRE